MVVIEDMLNYYNKDILEYYLEFFMYNLFL